MILIPENSLKISLGRKTKLSTGRRHSVPNTEKSVFSSKGTRQMTNRRETTRIMLALKTINDTEKCLTT